MRHSDGGPPWIDVHSSEVDVPEQAVQDGRLVLNISPQATRDLEMTNEAVRFQARFSGVSRDLWLPMNAVLAIYARENGQGMMFTGSDDESDDTPPTDTPDKPAGPKLRVIK